LLYLKSSFLKNKKGDDLSESILHGICYSKLTHRSNNNNKGDNRKNKKGAEQNRRYRRSNWRFDSYYWDGVKHYRSVEQWWNAGDWSYNYKAPRLSPYRESAEGGISILGG